MDWRTIPFRRYDPYIKTGLNDAALRSAADGDALFWLSGWQEPCINVGRSQRVADEVDIEAARQDGIPIVRRQGGGGAMYLTPDGEITWGLAAPRDAFPEELEDIYRQVCGRVADALGAIGIDARHEPVNDVVTDRGKLSGATARRTDGAVYVGGTLLYDVDPSTMFRYLTPSGAKEEHRDGADRARIATVNGMTDADRDELIAAVREAFLHDRATDDSDWTDEEMEHAREQAETYRNDDWIFMHGD